MSDQILRVKEQIIRPRKTRICVDCDRTIRRNLAITDDGQAHHWGCLKKGHAQPVYRCLNCGSELTRAEATVVYVEGLVERHCSCGGLVEPIPRDNRDMEVIHG
jgi:hypothetical protein